MESLITETRLPEELNAFKATAGLLATQKIRYSANYVPPLEERQRKATLVNVRTLSLLGMKRVLSLSRLRSGSGVVIELTERYEGEF